MANKAKVSKSGRGGRRPGAGRKPLWDTPLCSFVVDTTRRIAKERMRERQFKLLEKWKPEYRDIADLQSQLRRGSSPDPDTMADIQYHFDAPTDGGLGLPRYIPAIGLSAVGWGQVYAEVAALASGHFKRAISRRQVKRCIAEWLKFESSIAAELSPPDTN
jgi:hypothetical protein